MKVNRAASPLSVSERGLFSRSDSDLTNPIRLERSCSSSDSTVSRVVLRHFLASGGLDCSGSDDAVVGDEMVCLRAIL